MSTSVKITLIVVALAVIVGAGYLMIPKGTGNNIPSSQMANQPVVTQPITTVTESGSPVSVGSGGPGPSVVPAETTVTSKNLSYIATYEEPEGTAKISFDLVVDTNGVIAKVSTKNLTSPSNRETTQYQQKFSTAIGGQIVGKKLADLKDLDRVGGASLTTDAFNSSLAQLKAQL